MNKVSVILPAAGSGSRFGASANKIFQPLAGVPIFLRTCSRFAARADVSQLLLIVSAEDTERLQTEFAPQLAELGVQLVGGGPTRTDSVRNALAKVDAEADLVAVHDAVRPCVRSCDLDAVFAAAGRHGAAMLAWPEHATLKRVDADRIIRQTVDRSGLWQAQTPQVFRRDWLVEAYRAAQSSATDDAGLVEAIGHAVRIVQGDPRNLKITTPADLEIAQAVWPTIQ
ncbi:MAG: 2-C-methyl-D-erythritol 4-phosphate cytidylyltransferase [Phycisphaerae bacterium]